MTKVGKGFNSHHGFHTTHSNHPLSYRRHWVKVYNYNARDVPTTNQAMQHIFPFVEEARADSRRRIKNLVSRYTAKRDVEPRINARINARKIVQSGLSTEYPLPDELYRNIAEFTGKGLKPHQIKNSKAAKANMAYVRSCKHK